jgi:hypothetical protein
MQVEYSLTLDDFLALHRYHLNHPPARRRHTPWVLRLVLAFLTFMAFLNLLTSWNDNEPQAFKHALVWALLMVAVLVGYLFRHWILARLIKRSLQQGKNAKLLKPQRLTITPEGITQDTGHSTATVAWEALEGIGTTEDHAFFYTNTVTAYVLPRRAFANDGEFEEFVEKALRYYEGAGSRDIHRVTNS